MGGGNGDGKWKWGNGDSHHSFEMGTATILSYFMCHNNYCFFGLPGEWSVDSM